MKPKGLYVLSTDAFPLIYGDAERRDIAELVDIYAPPQTRESVEQNPRILAEAEVILSGWGAPILDQHSLRAMPKLRAFFYGAGGTGGLVYPEAWARGIQVTSAACANAVPVAEFTLAAIIFALKNAIPLSRQVHRNQSFPVVRPVTGTYGSTVGLASLGAVGRAVVERLHRILPDITLLAYDPYLSDAEIIGMGVIPVTLEELFLRSEVVSLHTPWLPETDQMIKGHHLASMKERATLINTARGGIIAQEEMIPVLTARSDLTAMLDVAQPEPPEPDSALYTLPNVFLTPHIAGSMEAECRRMGRYMVEELQRYCRGEAFFWSLQPGAALQQTIHRLPSVK